MEIKGDINKMNKSKMKMGKKQPKWTNLDKN